MKKKISSTIANLKSIGADMTCIAHELRRHHEAAPDVADRGVIHRLAAVSSECGRNIVDEIASKAHLFAVTQ